MLVQMQVIYSALCLPDFEIHAASTIYIAYTIILYTCRQGSVIIEHRVEYDYNDMSNEDKSLSAEEIFAKTMQVAVDEGFRGNLTFTNCSDCLPPECKYNQDDIILPY